MYESDLKLVRPAYKFSTAPRGKYARLLQQFLASGEDELEVKTSNAVNAYNGLLNAIHKAGLDDRVAAQKQRRDVHLVRLG